MWRVILRTRIKQKNSVKTRFFLEKFCDECRLCACASPNLFARYWQIKTKPTVCLHSIGKTRKTIPYSIHHTVHRLRLRGNSHKITYGRHVCIDTISSSYYYLIFLFSSPVDVVVAVNGIRVCVLCAEKKRIDATQKQTKHMAQIIHSPRTLPLSPISFRQRCCR